MKRLMLICVMILCLMPVVMPESVASSSFDFGFSESGEGFAPGTVLYLPDFTGIGSHWEILSVSGGDDYVRVTVTPIPLSLPDDTPDAVYTYEVRLEGVEAEDAFVCLELVKDGVPSWRYNLYVIVDPSLDVKIQSAELIPAHGDISNVVIDYGASEHFTQDEMDAAIAVILNDFSAIHRSDQENHLNAWAGFVLHEIHYVSDERSRDRFETYGIHYGYRDSQGRPYVDGIYFQSSFHTMMTEDGRSGFENGRNYDGYGWTLLLTEDGEWEIVTSGY
ncbi:MAG: hypothetical protein IKH57_03410 [Clostridia bacterium]|nr:hypothetical protein [Clostridia bacterium]